MIEPKFISEGKGEYYSVLKINYEKGNFEKDLEIVRCNTLTSRGFDKRRSFNSNMIEDSDNKLSNEIMFRNQALKNLEKSIISEAKKQGADFILIDYSTNNGS